MRNFLIVDESRALRTILKSYLLAEFNDVELREAATAAIATEALQTQAFDIVVCAHEMHEMNGLAIYQASCQTEYNQATPFLLVTHAVTPEIMERCTRSEDLYQIAAPFTADELREKITEISDPRKNRFHARVMARDVKAIVMSRGQPLVAGVINLSMNGLLCEMDYPSTGIHVAEINQMTLVLPLAQDHKRTEPIHIRLLRIEFLSYQANNLPEKLRMACQFVAPAEPTRLYLAEYITQTQKSLDALSY